MPLKNLGLLHTQLLAQTNSLGFKDIQLPNNFKEKYKGYLIEATPNGYRDIEWDQHTSRITTSSGKLIYASNYWFYIASELANYIEALFQYKDIFKAIFNGSNLKEVADQLKNGLASAEEKEKIHSYFSNVDDERNFLEFVENYSAWGGGKTIDRNDFYVSPVLKSGNLLAETQSAIAEIANQLSNNVPLWKLLKDQVSLAPFDSINISSSATKSTQLPKPFLLLAGISGTGKTRFVREQAGRFNANFENYCLVAVRPDWHEPSDLLGYISRIGGNGARYIATDFLRFLVAAWKHIEGQPSKSEQAIPYWLCLDEMNLAPVEQYFSDYLSIIETRRWEGGEYQSDAILSSGIFKDLNDAGRVVLRADLGLDGSQYDDLWKGFVENGISIPSNLIVAGTVNMDETTHGFSRKVIDRAFTLDFGEFFPNDYTEFFNPKTQPVTLSYPVISQATLDDLSSVQADPNGQKSIDFLDEINNKLRQTPFELAFRALNELLIAVVNNQPSDEIALQSVWDDFLMTKVLPRIEGDTEKLRDDGETNLLKELEKLLSGLLGEVWDKQARIDLLREATTGADLMIACRSQKKIAWMQARLSSNGFTSFWP